MTFVSPYVDDWLHMVVPQSPQKYRVTVAPLSAFLAKVLGVPLEMVKEAADTTRLVENREPVILRQSVQWQRA